MSKIAIKFKNLHISSRCNSMVSNFEEICIKNQKIVNINCERSPNDS